LLIIVLVNTWLVRQCFEDVLYVGVGFQTWRS
jgi:hypothetical protein